MYLGEIGFIHSNATLSRVKQTVLVIIPIGSEKHTQKNYDLDSSMYEITQESGKAARFDRGR